MLWLYFHFPALQLDTMYKNEDAQALPLIIVHKKNNEVIQLNQLAQQEGINIGMGLGTAASLCQKLQVKPYDHEAEAKALKHIAHWLYPLTADICLFPPDGLLLKVSNMLSLYQDLNTYWQSVSQHLTPLLIDYQYATGYSPYAARLLAREKLNQISEDKNWLLNQVKKLRLTNSDIHQKDIARLHKVGVNKFSDLLSLSLAELSKRFNIEVVNYIGCLTGQIQHKVDFYIPPEGFEQYLELYYEISNSLSLEKPLLKLYQQLEAYLRKKDKLVSELSLMLHQRDSEDLILFVKAAQGEYKADKWWQLSQLLLESVKLSAPIIGITLKAKQLVTKYAHHADFFRCSQGNQSSEELIDILTAKLGKKRVRGVQIKQDDRPEIANGLCTPLLIQNDTFLVNKLRPTLLLPSPQPLTEKVTVMPYPERVVTGWWDNNQIMRDYFIARNDHGCWLWLFKDNSQRWFVHGVFS